MRPSYTCDEFFFTEQRLGIFVSRINSTKAGWDQSLVYVTPVEKA